MATFIIYIIRWAVVLTMLYALYGLFMKRETLHSVNRIVLLLILAASMVLPLVQVETRENNILAQGREMLEQQIQTEEYVLVSARDNSVINTKGEHVANKGLTWMLLLVAIYVLGVIIAWLRYLWSLAALLLLISKGECRDIQGLPKGITVLTHPAVSTPCSWMRWIILNPADIGTRAIIKHEMAHIQYGHSWDMLFCELTCRMLWFVPFAWMLRQDLRDVHEYQADRSVLRSGIDENEYQLLLIRKATSTGLQPVERSNLFALPRVENAFNQSPIKRRFKMMYRKPSRRWVALKAAYLLPLSALAVVAFARPQTMSEIEEKVEEGTGSAASLVQEVTNYVASAVGSHDKPVPTEQADPVTLPTTAEDKDTVQVLSDANLVNADLAESGPSVLGGSSAKSATELLDSTMLAVGARKIAEGTYIGHFQPNLNSDTVRIARATILDRKSQQTDEHLYTQNAAAPDAYHITLNAETRKDRKGYYIRYLQPVNSTVRNYDKKEVDPKMLSTDSVLTKRRSKYLMPYAPIALSQTKKEARIFMYVWFGNQTVANLLKEQDYLFNDLAIVDEKTGDQYVCRSVDYSYFKYVKDETVGNDTVKVYQVCLVFPPFGKHVNQVYFDRMKSEHLSFGTFFSLNDLPRKGRVITK